MNSLISANVLRLSEVRKNWNIRGIDILVEENMEMVLEIVKEDSKTRFMIKDFYDIQLLGIEQCPQYQSKDLNIQYVLLLKTNEKDIVLGTIDLIDDMVLFCDIIISLIHETARRRQFYCDKFADLF